MTVAKTTQERNPTVHIRPVPLPRIVAITFAGALAFGNAALAETPHRVFAAPTQVSETTKVEFDVGSVKPEMDLIGFARGLIKEVDAAPQKVRFLARGKLGQSAGHARTHGRYVAAAMLVGHAIDLLEDSPLGSPARIAAERAALGDLQRHLGHFAEAEGNFRRAMALLRTAGTEGDGNAETLLYPMAVNQADRGQFNRAEALLIRVLDRTETSDPRALPVLNQLGRVYRLQRRFADAEIVLLHALDIVENGPLAAAADGGLGRATFEALGRLYQDWGRYDEAERYFRRNLDADEARGLAGDPQLSRSLNSLGELYVVQGRLAAAGQIFTRALANLNGRLGPPLPLVGTIADNLANVLTAEHEFADAKPLFKRAIAVQRASAGTDHPDFAATLLDIAAWFEAQDRPGDAGPLVKRAYQIYAKAFGGDHPKTTNAWRKYSNLHAERETPAGPTVQ